MIDFIPTVSGVSANIFDMTDAITPIAGTVLIGLFLSSLAGIVIPVLADRWLTQSARCASAAEYRSAHAGVLCAIREGDRRSVNRSNPAQ